MKYILNGTRDVFTVQDEQGDIVFLKKESRQISASNYLTVTSRQLQLDFLFIGKPDNPELGPDMNSDELEHKSDSI